MTGTEFILREHQGVRYYSCLAFEKLPNLRHGFSTRHGGAPDLSASSLNLSEMPWDSPARVKENRSRLLSALNIPDVPLITLSQIHSSRVHIIEDISAQWNDAEGDAIATREENIALAVKTADCMPVLIVDPMKRAVAAVHSGWRGTLSGVLLCTVQEMRRAFGSDPSQLLTAIGPGIRACCYEVGRDVADLFGEAYPECCSASPAKDHRNKFLLDLGSVLAAQLDQAGIRPENRHDLGLCTCCNKQEFFSHRAEGSSTGRMMSIIGISDNPKG